jgi:outer membrane protein OmpA-like peptidoglycan-associated protein
VLLAALALGARRKGVLLAVAGLVAIPGVASAQEPRLNIDGFGSEMNSQPATFTLVRDAAQTRRGTISGDLTASYGLNPLEYEDGDDINPRGDVIDTRVGLNLGFNAAVTNWLEIGLQMPVLESVFYADVVNNGVAQSRSLGGSGDRYGIGDLRFQFGVGALQQSKGMPINLSLIPQLVVPTGSQDIFMGTGSIQAGGDLAIGGSWDHFRFSATGGYMWQDRSRQVGDIYQDDTARWGAAIAVPFMDRQIEPQIEYKGSQVVTDAARDALPDFDWHRHTPMQLLFSLLWAPNDLPIYIKGGVGPGVTQGYGMADVTAFLQVGAKTMPRKLEVACITDADGDAVSDCYDVCPYKAEDVDGFQDADGCPDLDNDNDSIADAEDACINRPEVFNDYEDTDGCPDEVASAVAVEQNEIVLFDKIYFEYDRAELRPVSQRVLDQVAQTLKDHPEIGVVELDGHADERGTQWYNVELSKQRGESVRNYLIGQGIDPARLTVMAYGEEMPAVPNASDEAEYAQNRRVQLKVTTTDQGLGLDQIRTADADVPAIPEGFDPPNTDNDIPGQDVQVPLPG